MIKSVFQSCIDSGKYRHIFQGEILTETCSEVRCLGVVNFCLFVTHAGAGQWLRAGPALSKSPWGLIIVTFGCDDSHPRICFMWLHSEQPICVPASGFCIFVILCHLSSQRFENLKIWKICCYCTMFVFERSDLCLQYIVCLCALPLIVASISFCETNDVLYSQLSLLDSESIVACVHPSLTYLMAGFCRRPAAQIEKFSVTKWNAWLCLRSRKIEDCSILIPDSISDVLHAATKVDFRPTVVDISAARTHDEWVNIDEHKRCTQAIFPPLSVIVGVEVGRRGEMKRPLAPLGARNPSPYSEYSLWSSERDINLTLRLWAFICLWEMRSAAQMTVPILQIPLTVGVRTNTHTVHCRASATSLSLLVSGIRVCGSGECTVALLGLDWGSSCSFVSILWLFGQKQHKLLFFVVEEKWERTKKTWHIAGEFKVILLVCWLISEATKLLTLWFLLQASGKWRMG